MMVANVRGLNDADIGGDGCDLITNADMIIVILGLETLIFPERGIVPAPFAKARFSAATTLRQDAVDNNGPHNEDQVGDDGL